MSIFGNIVSKIFGSKEAATAPAAQADAPAPAPTAAAPQTSPVPSPADPVDVESVLDGMLANAGQKLNWRESIVDLMKLLVSTAAFRLARNSPPSLAMTAT